MSPTWHLYVAIAENVVDLWFGGAHEKYLMTCAPLQRILYNLQPYALGG